MKLFYNFKVDTFESVYMISPPRDSQLRLKVRNLKQAFVKNIEIVEITRIDNKM